MQTFQHAIGQLRHRQQLLAILVFSLMAIVVWIGVSLIGSQRKTSISPELRSLADPLTPTINQAMLEAIEAREYASEDELGDFPIFTVADPKANQSQPAESPEASPSASVEPSASPEPIPTPSASESATIDAE